MQNFIAERHLVAVSKVDGLRKEVLVRIGIPYWIEEAEVAGCSVEYKGLFDSFADRQGIDLLQALQIASDIDPFLKAMSDEYDFYWQSGESYEFEYSS
jgi:hypothetical protein